MALSPGRWRERGRNGPALGYPAQGSIFNSRMTLIECRPSKTRHGANSFRNIVNISFSVSVVRVLSENFIQFFGEELVLSGWVDGLLTD